MSDGKEVRLRWKIASSLRETDIIIGPPTFEHVEVMPVTEHESIVAELRAEVERLTRELLQCYQLAESGVWVETGIYEEKIKTISTQARVIEKLKERLTSWISETHPNDEHLRNMCLMVEERELAAIEKEGAKDDANN